MRMTSAYSGEGSGREREKPVTYGKSAQFSSTAAYIECTIPEPSGKAKMEKIQPQLSRA